MLPKNETAIDFNFTSETGKKYDGTFTVRCTLNIGQKHAMALEKTRLLGNHTNPTDDLMGLAVILSTLRAKIIDGPNWWTQSIGGWSIEDEDVLVELFDKVQDAEREWRKSLTTAATKTANEAISA
jgi:hypothetical protein